MAAVVSGRQTANQKEYGRDGRESEGTRPLPRTRGIDPAGYYGTHARAREFIASKDTSHWKIYLSDRVIDIETSASAALMALLVPQAITIHLIFGIKATLFGETFGEAKRHRSVVGPFARFEME